MGVVTLSGSLEFVSHFGAIEVFRGLSLSSCCFLDSINFSQFKPSNFSFVNHSTFPHLRQRFAYIAPVHQLKVVHLEGWCRR